jgi:hypothetical protein
MRRLKIPALTATALAALALSAIATAVAGAAQPELVKEGKAGVPLTQRKFTTERKGETLTLENANKETVKCTEEKGSGEGVLNSTKAVEKVTVEFFGCKSGTGLKCENNGAEKIKTNALNGEIGYIKGTAGTTKVVGLLLKPETGTTFATFVCGGFANNTVTGAVIGEMTPKNVRVKTTEFFKAIYEKGATAGSQKFTELEGEGAPKTLQSSLFGGTPKASNEQGDAQVKFEEEAELLA